MMEWDEMNILITGGTSCFGRMLSEIILRDLHPKKLIIFSHDELKQYGMQQKLREDCYPNIRYFIGDIRDRDRLYRAFDGVDVVIHTAVIKEEATVNYNPFEAVKTNILGAMNIVDAAIDRNVKKVVAISSSHSVNPVSLSTATTFCSDKIFIAANNYAGQKGTCFSVVRYGDFVESRSSLFSLLSNARENRVLSIPDPQMTRFWITMEQGVKFLLTCLEHMFGTETFVLKVPSVRIADLARVIAPGCETKTTGVLYGEELHEVLLSESEARRTLEYNEFYAILPFFIEKAKYVYVGSTSGFPCCEGFRYSSNTNTQWLSVEELRAIIRLMAKKVNQEANHAE